MALHLSKASIVHFSTGATATLISTGQYFVAHKISALFPLRTAERQNPLACNSFYKSSLTCMDSKVKTYQQSLIILPASALKVL